METKICIFAEKVVLLHRRYDKILISVYPNGVARTAE